ncbi:MAG TPA: hypothetical protein VGB37_08390 [Candidatus Lokiarchaeia archaeon]
MSLILRIDVEHPYGKKPLFNHMLSRISSDLYFPKIELFKYLNDLKVILKLLNQINARSYIFFRRCTMPTSTVLELIDKGNHIIGLHLENSRSFNTFKRELGYFAKKLNHKIYVFSKHGSGKKRYGLYHYAPYDPKKYVEWGKRLKMKIFFGNLENPTSKDYYDESLLVFPSAFWLEPFWRNTKKFNIDWLINEAYKRDVVLLIHPNALVLDKDIKEDFFFIINKIPTKIIK